MQRDLEYRQESWLALPLGSLLCFPLLLLTGRNRCVLELHSAECVRAPWAVGGFSMAQAGVLYS